ncbi:hypothetical protein BN844_2387 [Pseudomonas sp. SHC52]|nr:hypothetical protein BN844_2387 [Pseudomonas sp. SHC52]
MSCSLVSADTPYSRASPLPQSARSQQFQKEWLGKLDSNGNDSVDQDELSTAL